MSNKLFVGSLAWGTTDESLRSFFAQAGNVLSASVITERDTGRSKGFGFVEMSTAEEAQAAKDQLNGKELDGRAISVDIARPREENSERRPFRRDNDRGSYGGNRGGGHRSRF